MLASEPWVVWNNRGLTHNKEQARGNYILHPCMLWHLKITAYDPFWLVRSSKSTQMIQSAKFPFNCKLIDQWCLYLNKQIKKIISWKPLTSWLNKKNEKKKCIQCVCVCTGTQHTDISVAVWMLEKQHTMSNINTTEQFNTGLTKSLRRFLSG